MLNLITTLISKTVSAQYILKSIFWSFVCAVLFVPLICLPASAASSNYCTSGNQITISDVQNMINMFLGITPNNGCSGVIIPPSTNYAQSDLQGTWHFFQFIAGSNSGWARANLTIDSQGNVNTSNSVNSDGGGGGMSSFKMGIDSTGVISTNDPTSTTRLNLASNKFIAVGTGESAGDESLYFMVKSGSGFQQSDLQGTWRMQDLVHQGKSGNANENVWQRANVSISSTGAATVSSGLASNGSGTTGWTVAPFNFVLNSQGTVTATLNPTFYGVLTADKNLMIAMYTNGNGSIGLSFFVKTGSTDLSNADLTGLWRTNFLAISDIYWGRALTAFNTSGLGSITQITQSNGTRPNSSIQFSLANNGILTSNEWGAEGGFQTFGGIMSLDKNLMIGTLTQDRVVQPHPTLVIWIK